MSSQNSPLNSTPNYFEYPQLKSFVESITHAPFYSRGHVWHLMKIGQFPKALTVSAHKIWSKTDVVAWLRDRGVVVPSDAE